MHTRVWNKYLPIIKILLKRSASSTQTLDMNRSDFERAAGGRKVRYSFEMLLLKGRVDNSVSQTPLAKQLAAVLLEDTTTRTLVRQNDYQFKMKNNFQLNIQNSTPQALPEEETLVTNEPGIEESAGSDVNTTSKS
jgi:hypothetical protein